MPGVRRGRPCVRVHRAGVAVSALASVAVPGIACALGLVGAVVPLVATATAWQRAVRPADGTPLLPKVPSGVQLSHDGDRLVVVDALLTERAVPIAAVATVDALVQGGRGVLRLRLRDRDGATIADLDGPGWGEQVEVVARARRELGDLGVGWTETPVPRGATVHTLTGVGHRRPAVRPLASPQVLTSLGFFAAIGVLVAALAVDGLRPFGPLSAVVLLAHVTVAGILRRADSPTRRPS